MTDSQISKLLSIDPKTVGRIPFEGQVIPARIDEVYDGDTVHVIIMLSDFPLKISVRLVGIDCPEVRKGKGVTDQEKNVGLRIKKYAKRLFKDQQICDIKLTDKDVYCSRFVGEVYLNDGSSMSQHMLTQGLAKPYKGDKKTPWTEEELDRIDRRLIRAGY